MTDRILSPKEVRQLQKRYQELQSEIAQLGWIAQGSLMHTAPNAWRLTRKIKAKTLTTALSQAQASLFVQAIANHRRLEELLAMTAIAGRVLVRPRPGAPSFLPCDSDSRPPHDADLRSRFRPM